MDKDKIYREAIIKAILKAFPIGRSFVEFLEDIEKQVYDTQLKNDLHLIAQGLIATRDESRQAFKLIESKLDPLTARLIESNEGGSIFKDLENMKVYLREKVDKDLSNNILFAKLKYDESESFIPSINQDDYAELLHYFPSSFTVPALAANLADILVESRAHNSVGTDLDDEIIKKLRKSEKIIMKQGLEDQVKGYEVLGAFGLLCNQSEYYEKYLQKYKIYDPSNTAEVIRRTSWWNREHYHGNQEIMTTEYLKVLENPNYNQLNLYSAYMLATNDFEYVQEILELLNINDDSPLYNILKKLKLKQ
ncbi:MAG: hypothetical protein AAF489_13250 [Bacteroidota bacterium]